MDKTKVKKIIFIVIACLSIFTAGFGASYLISKTKYTKSVDKLGELLGDGKYSATELYSELGRRLTELDTIRKQLDSVGLSINECSDIVKQSGDTIGQLGGSVDELTATATNIGDLIKQLKSGQREITNYVEQLKRDNQRLEDELGKLQEDTHTILLNNAN